MFQDALLQGTVEGLERKVSQSFGNDQCSVADPCICFCSVLCSSPHSTLAHSTLTPGGIKGECFAAKQNGFCGSCPSVGPAALILFLISSFSVLSPLIMPISRQWISPSLSPYLLYECHIRLSPTGIRSLGYILIKLTA